MFEWGGGDPKGVGVRGTQEKKIKSFKFACLKWPILVEITAKSGIFFHFHCQQGGPGNPPVVQRGRPGSR